MILYIYDLSLKELPQCPKGTVLLVLDVKIEDYLTQLDARVFSGRAETPFSGELGASTDPLSPDRPERLYCQNVQCWVQPSDHPCRVSRLRLSDPPFCHPELTGRQSWVSKLLILSRSNGCL